MNRYGDGRPLGTERQYMPIAEELMRFGAGLNTTDQDIAMAIKMAAAVIEQIESGEDREFRIAFTFDEFIRLPWHWELLGGRLAFRCKRWEEENLRKYPETDGLPPLSEGDDG